MASGNGNPDWEAVAKRQLASQAEARGRNVSTEAHRVGCAFERGELTREDVRRFRNTVAELLAAVEDDIIGRHPDFTAYDNGEPYIRGYSMVAAYLGVEMPQLEEILDGAIVDLDDQDLTALANGFAVVTSTEGGIGVEIQAPDGAAEVDPGP